jgi:lipid-A-disaccharide synthase-like uncharacterized protein
MSAGGHVLRLSLAFLGASSEGAIDLPEWNWPAIALAAQGLVMLCFLTQLLAFLGTSRVVLPMPLILFGLAAAVVALVYAVLTSAWVLALADAANLFAGLQLLLWRNKLRAKPGPQRRPGLPVVAPHTAEPKSGVMPRPRPESQTPTK